MATRSARAMALSNEEIASLRQRLSDGGRPRVHLSGPLFPDGSTGTVLRVGDPAIDGADYITVRVKLNGTTDELAFAPAELSMRAPKPKPAGRRATPAGRKAAEPAAVPQAAPAAVAAPTAAEPEPPAESQEQAEPSKPVVTPAPPVTQRRRPAPRSATAGAPGVSASEAGKTRSSSTPSTGAAKRRKATPIPTVSFTVTSSGATWAVSATRGAKGLVKNVPVPPGTVTALADLLDQPGLVEAVAEINETAWAEAQTRAELLRAELEELEAVLAAHRSPH